MSGGATSEAAASFGAMALSMLIAVPFDSGVSVGDREVSDEFLLSDFMPELLGTDRCSCRSSVGTALRAKVVVPVGEVGVKVVVPVGEVGVNSVRAAMPSDADCDRTLRERTALKVASVDCHLSNNNNNNNGK